MSTPNRYWFVPRRRLFVPRGANTPQASARLRASRSLRRADSPIESGVDQMVEDGQPFSIVVRSIHAAENFDQANESHNDLLVRSWVRYGSDPEIELLHCFQADVPPLVVLHGQAIASPHVLAHERHQVDKRVWVKVQVVDVDSRKLKRVAQVLRSERVEAIAQATGAVFPGTLPFLHSVIEDATPLFHGLRELVGNTDDVILDQTLDFLSQDSGETPFRYGVYVFFQEAIDASIYQLHEFALELKGALVSDIGGDMDDAQGNPRAIDAASAIPAYVVLEVMPTVFNPMTETAQTTLLRQQQLAAGLRFPDDDGSDGPLTKRFEYLQGLFKKATQLDDVLDYLRLRQLHQAGQTLNGFESKRFLDLENRLSDYVDLIDELLD